MEEGTHLIDILTSPAKDKPLWFELIGISLTFLSIVVSILLAAWGYRRAFGAWEKQKKRELELLHKHKKQEIKLQFEKQRYEHQLNAAQGVWPLLAYFSLWENDKSIFVKRGKQWYFRQEQAKSFILALPETFFDKGYGVFMPTDVKANLYHLRGMAYELLQASKSNGDDDNEVLLKNQNMVQKKDKQADPHKKSVEELKDEINASLRHMLQRSEIELD